jgi:L-threonylcarbamoyladenylate synthase
MLVQKIDEAIEILKKGGIVVFPTETAFGVGCRLDNRRAVKRLVKIRRREKGKPFLVLVSSLAMVKKYFKELPKEVKDLMKKFWPGPLTIIYFCKQQLVPSLVRAGKETLGMRLSPHKIARQLVKGVDVPLLAPSANFAGEPTPYKFSDLKPDLLKQVDLVIKAPCGKYKKASTVIDCTRTPFQILREGSIKKEEIF